MEYFFHILVVIQINVILAVSLNLISGYCGLLSLAHSAFYGIGAYTAALMWQYFGIASLSLNILIGCFVSSVLSLLLTYPSIKGVHDDFFVISTVGFQIIVFNIFNNCVSFTNGPLGISGIPFPSILTLSIDTSLKYFFFSLFFTIIIYVFVNRLVKSPFGLIIRGIREDEIFTMSAGKNINKYKILVSIISCSVASIAGVLYGHYSSFVDPSSFTINESIFLISIIIIGGIANIKGSILGAIILIILPELFRFVGMPISVAANLRQILYGSALVLFMMFRPHGLIGEYNFTNKTI